MSRDVYSGDDALTGLTGEPDSTLTAEFFIEADGEVDVACRVASVLRLANRAVTRGSLISDQGGGVTIRVEMDGLSLTTVENLLRKLSQLTCVLESQARVTGPGLPVSSRILRATEEGITFHDCQEPPQSGCRADGMQQGRHFR
ncbi:MAG: hypothetical protein AMXMBFR37_12910 [Steroidobacteraceae bacterium]